MIILKYDYYKIWLKYVNMVVMVTWMTIKFEFVFNNK